MRHAPLDAERGQEVGGVLQERLGRADEERRVGRGPFPFGQVVETGEQVGDPVQADLALPAAGRPLHDQRAILRVRDGLVLVRLYRLDDDGQRVIAARFAQGFHQRVRRALALSRLRQRATVDVV